MGVDKQVDIAATVAPGATANLREGEKGGRKERGGWGETPELKLTDRNP